MKERPILFSGSMVRAILAGTKNQTRRVVKPQPPASHTWAGWCVTSTHRADEGKATWAAGTGPYLRDAHRVACPYGQPGDRLWVRENGWERPHCTQRMLREGADTWPRYEYDAEPVMCWEDGELKRLGWKRRPSIHMPRWASRITLEITEVRVERLQDISEVDALAEGIERDAITDNWSSYGQFAGAALTPKGSYRALWESINGEGSWEANPWVWAVSFKRVETSSLVRPHVFHDLTCNSLGLSLGEASQGDQADGTAVAVTHNKAGQELAVEAAGGGHELHLSGPFGSTWETQCKAHPRGHGHGSKGGTS